MLKTLLIGAGARRDKLIQPDGTTDWGELTTLDINSYHNVDIVWDLEILPLPFPDNTFNEIHAYEVLEHTGRQGDYKFFFAQFTDFWRILKPNGFFCASVPAPGSPWVWGDPSHTRFLPPECFVFLDQEFYREQIGKSPMSDFRYMYHADLLLVYSELGKSSLFFVLQARK